MKQPMNQPPGAPRHEHVPWSRRHFALAVPLLGGIGALGMLGAGPAQATPAPSLRASRALLGTQVDIVVADAPSQGQAQLALQQAFARMQQLQAQMSRFHPDSIVQRLQANAGRQPVAVTAEILQVLQQAKAVWKASHGAFDPTVGALAQWRFAPEQPGMPTVGQIAQALPHVDGAKLHLDAAQGIAYLAEAGMALDLGGIAKLPILAAGLQTLQEHGIHDALINGGGDVLAIGTNHGKAWRVGVRNPLQPQQLLGVIAVQGAGVVVSSGDYERCFERAGQRYHHVLDPRTGWPTTQVHGVALFARSVQEVNGWGTALMVQGPGTAPSWSAHHPTVAALLASADGQIWRNTAMDAALLPVV